MYCEQPPPVVIDPAHGVKAKSAAAIAVCGGLGALGVSAGSTGQVSGGTGVAVAAGVVGGLLLLIAVIAALLWRVLTRPRSLVIEQAGVRWTDPRGSSWSIAWPELAAISVSRTVNRNPRKIVPSAMVRLDLFPADPGFRQRHPEMERLWELHRVRQGYRVPFGDVPDSHDLVPRLDESLRMFAGPRYQGVSDEGFTAGLF
ncbi:hypothetical protein DFR70_11170 [Nocardia tenerifensis]|uniref:PH (Pleckstrin Homology) domain-containing protein n=1 Tax=Nocardia tenerifensis TaxID=228006 RepID=A0A318K7B6_9NOCA|nr:hypothetical protein [Nocardia tenerifensis]PXX59688.1 hypothetical protein DFR70_11170 [Nocardia tenerifensis]